MKLLTEGERECLRLVFQHMTSKDIARQLGVSHHAVDMRLRNAIRKLDVDNRIDAARALIADEGISSTESMATDYQPLIYQASELEENAGAVTFGSPASHRAGAAFLRSSDPNQLEPGSLARAPHSPQTRPDVGPAGGTLAQPSALTGNVTLGSTLATDWPGIAAPDPGIDARPFLSSRPWGSRNDLAIGHRLGWILFIAFASAMTFGGILAALAALKTLI
ncbi:MAG: LuxR C-terminal-related transcriptional regulator [Sandarakinorhabdus sp.]